MCLPYDIALILLDLSAFPNRVLDVEEDSKGAFIVRESYLKINAPLERVDCSVNFLIVSLQTPSNATP